MAGVDTGGGIAVRMTEPLDDLPALPGYSETKQAHLKRLRRIEGQVRGIARMVEQDQYCIDVLTQVSAATKALQAVALGLLDEHLSHCVVDAVAAGRRRARHQAPRGVRRDRPAGALMSPVESTPVRASTYAVTGLTCTHCAAAVREELWALPGVTQVHVDLVAGGTSSVTVLGTAEPAHTDVVAALHEAGEYRLAAG